MEVIRFCEVPTASKAKGVGGECQLDFIGKQGPVFWQAVFVVERKIRQRKRKPVLLKRSHRGIGLVGITYLGSVDVDGVHLYFSKVSQEQCSQIFLRTEGILRIFALLGAVSGDSEKRCIELQVLDA